MYENIMISVIVPVYNGSNYIKRSVDSIIKQTHVNLEIIIVDDGSTDETGIIIDELASQDNRIIAIHKKNEGVSSARMEGIIKSIGDYITFVDADDELEIDMYDFLLQNAIKYNADISHCGYQVIYNNDSIKYFYNTNNVIIQNREQGICDLLEGNFVEPSLCNKLFNRKLFSQILKNNLMDISIKINEDLLMNYYLFSQSRQSVYHDKCKYHYLVRNNSASRGHLNENMIYDPIKVRRKIIENSDNITIKTALKVYVRTCINIYNRLMFEDDLKYTKDIKYIYSIIKKNKQYISLLEKKSLYVGYLIIYTGNIYRYIYKVYARFFRNHL